MKPLQNILAAVSMLSLILIVLVTSAEVAIYGDFGFYEREYRKYGVLKELDMEMDDVMQVTHEMMDYLRGDREDLVVETTVGEKTREFFNDREKAHMVDVKGLFLGGLRIRTAAAAVFAVSILLLLLLKADIRKLLAKVFQIEVGILLLLSGAMAYLFTTDFTTYFYKFHEIFFDNDLWLLNPETDLMIRMLPEGFFFDFAMRIVIVFVTAMVVLLAGSVILRIRGKRREDKAVKE